MRREARRFETGAATRLRRRRRGRIGRTTCPSTFLPGTRVCKRQRANVCRASWRAGWFKRRPHHCAYLHYLGTCKLLQPFAAQKTGETCEWTARSLQVPPVPPGRGSSKAGGQLRAGRPTCQRRYALLGQPEVPAPTISAHGAPPPRDRLESREVQ